jgi:hypothetical protein
LRLQRIESANCELRTANSNPQPVSRNSQAATRNPQAASRKQQVPLCAPPYLRAKRFGMPAVLCVLRPCLPGVEQVLLDVGTRSLPLRHPTAHDDTGIDAPTVQGQGK